MGRIPVHKVTSELDDKLGNTILLSFQTLNLPSVELLLTLPLTSGGFQAQVFPPDSHHHHHHWQSFSPMK